MCVSFPGRRIPRIRKNPKQVLPTSVWHWTATKGLNPRRPLLSYVSHQYLKHWKGKTCPRVECSWQSNYLNKIYKEWFAKLVWKVGLGKLSRFARLGSAAVSIYLLLVVTTMEFLTSSSTWHHSQLESHYSKINTITCEFVSVWQGQAMVGLKPDKNKEKRQIRDDDYK